MLINRISSMTHSVTSVTTGFLVLSESHTWNFSFSLCNFMCPVSDISFLFLNIFFQLRVYLVEFCFFWIFIFPLMNHIPELIHNECTTAFSLFWILMIPHFLESLQLIIYWRYHNKSCMWLVYKVFLNVSYNVISLNLSLM